MAKHGTKTFFAKEDSLFHFSLLASHRRCSYNATYPLSRCLLDIIYTLILTLLILILLPRFRLNYTISTMPSDKEQNDKFPSSDNQSGGRVLTRAQRLRGESDAEEAEVRSAPLPTPLPPPPPSLPTVLSDNSNQPSSSSFVTAEPQSESVDIPLNRDGETNDTVNNAATSRPSRDVQRRRMSDERRSRSPSPTRLPFNRQEQQQQSNTNDGSDQRDESADANVEPSTSAHADPPNEPEQEGDYDIGFNVSPAKIFKKNSALQFRARPIRSDVDYTTEINKFRRAYVDFLRRQREERYKRGFKAHLSTCVKFNVIKNNEVVDSPSPNFTSKSRVIYNEDDIEERIQPQLETIQNQVEDYRDRGSHFVYHSIVDWTITICEFSPFVVGTHIPTPNRIKMIKACINVEQLTEEDKQWCLIDSISAILHPVSKNPQQAYHYRKFRKDYNLKGLTLPLTIKQTRVFERRNPSISLNIFGVEEKSSRSDGAPIFFPLSISDNRGADKKIVNLLLIHKGKNSHFLAIRDLARLTRRIKSTSTANTICCCFCLQHFGTKGPNAEQNFLKHKQICEELTPMTTEFPPPGSKLRFESWEKTERLHYVLAGDLETYERPLSGASNVVEEPLDEGEEKRYEWVTGKRSQQHAISCKRCLPFKPCNDWENSMILDCNLQLFSWAYHIDSSDPEEQFPLRLYQGEHPDEAFFRTLKEDALELNQRLHRNVAIQWTPEDKNKHDAATHCDSCKRPFSHSINAADGEINGSVVKVPDHDHR